jgi:hypothetical protein
MSSQDQPAKRSAMLFDFIFDFQNRSKFFTRLAPIPLRLIVGYGFMEHGFAKLGRGADSFALILHAIGTPAPYLLSWATILIEIFGGLAVLLGDWMPITPKRGSLFHADSHAEQSCELRVRDTRSLVPQRFGHLRYPMLA